MSHGGDDNSLKAVLVAVTANALVTVAKYVGFFLTASPALLAEAIHSTADVGNQLLLWIGIRQSAREADEEHPYGWGPARYLWNLKSAMGIFFLGCGVTLYHGIHSLEVYLHHEGPREVEPEFIGMGILVFALLLEGYSLLVALKGINQDKGDMTLGEYFREGDDPTSIGVLLEDAAAVAGVLIALVGVGLTQLLHDPLPDAIATLLIGALLGVVAVFLAKANGRLLIGASVSKKQIDEIRAALVADDLVERVEDLKTEILGQGRIRVKCEVDLYEKLIGQRIREALREDVHRLEGGEEPMKVLIDVVGRTVRITGKEIARLEDVIRKVNPNAVHIDLELL